MKPKFALRHFLALAGSSMMAVSSTQAVTYYWDNNGTDAGFGTAGGTWADTGSTLLNTDNTGVAAVVAPVITTTADRVEFGRAVAGLGLAAGTINLSGTVNVGTLGGGNTGTAQTVTLSGGTINFAAVGNFTMTNGFNLIIDSQITGAATSLTKDNINTTVRLNNANNSYTGATSFSGGLVVTSLANGGLNSSIGASSSAASNLQLGLGNRAGTLSYLGATNASTDRLFTIANNQGTLGQVGLQSNGDGTLHFTNTGAIAVTGGSIARQLNLGGANTGENILDPSLHNGSGGAVISINKADAGRWRLNNAGSSYTGVTTISGGILEVALLADGGSNSSIGASTNAATNLSLANGTTLRYVGSTNSTTDRGFTVNGTAAGHGATIESSGTGTLSFDNTVAIGWGTADQTRALTLGGTNTGANTMGKVIANNGTANTSLTKTGAGTWILDQDNTYDGTTAISEGTLLVNNTTGSGTGTGAVIVGANATLGGTGSISGAVTLNSGATLSPGASIESLGTGSNTWNGGSTIVFEFSTDGSTGTAGSEWDLLEITGTLGFGDATSSNPITFDLFTMLNATTAGSLGTWDPDADATWAGFVTTTSGITGFDSDLFAFDVTGFDNDINGSFSIAQSGNNLDLVYTAIPEPGAALLGGLGTLLLLRRRRSA